MLHGPWALSPETQVDKTGIRLLYREWLEGDVRVRNYCFDREETGRTDLVFELSRDAYDPVFSRIRLDRRSRN